MGVRGAGIRELRVSDVSPEVALARVRWALQGDRDQPLYEFDATDARARLVERHPQLPPIGDRDERRFDDVVEEVQVRT